jgi:peptide/nickel transport system permease protein
MKTFLKNLQELTQYPSAIFGLVIVVLLLALSVFALIKIPYGEAIRLWRGGEDVWYMNPKNAPPAWFNYFNEKKLAESFAVKAGEDAFEKKVTPGDQGTSTVEMTYNFDFSFDDYPQELILYFDTKYTSKQPFASIYLYTPDGREIRIGDFGVDREMTFRFSQDKKLIRRIKNDNVMQGLFSVPKSDPSQIEKGQYKLYIKALTFEPESEIDAEFVLHGQLYGWAGTDNNRRDIGVALLWGTPVAMAFGLLAALGTSILTMTIAAVGAWYGGWIDEVIQRITEINLVLPFLAILIMVGTFYSRSIWVILGVTILLSIFTGSIKSYRSIFMQVRESSYIEAARSYGASDLRIIFQYLIPRMIPLLIPTLVSSVPSYVFLEASLAVLGLGDPVLPTWGKIVDDAFANGALYKGYYYWILEPAVLLMITGLGFAMLGFALDRIFNPRLRGV